MTANERERRRGAHRTGATRPVSPTPRRLVIPSQAGPYRGRPSAQAEPTGGAPAPRKREPTGGSASPAMRLLHSLALI